MRVRLVMIGVALALTSAACSSASTTRTSEQPVEGSLVVEEFVDRRNDGRIVASLELATKDVADRFRDRIEGLAAWNFRSDVAEPCEERFPGTFSCLMSEYTDFHTVAGLSPWLDRMTVTVNDDGVISDLSFIIISFGVNIAPFNDEFSEWLAQAHPEEAAKMNGVVMTRVFTAADALIATRFVEEFVAQSDSYPLPSQP